MGFLPYPLGGAQRANRRTPIGLSHRWPRRPASQRIDSVAMNRCSLNAGIKLQIQEEMPTPAMTQGPRRYERLAATSQLSCGSFSVTLAERFSDLKDR